MTDFKLPPYSLFGLPTDILILILHHFLLVKDLAALSRTSRYFHALVNEFGWPGYKRHNPRPAMSLTKTRIEWPAMACVKHDIITDRAWSHSQFMARPLSAPWPGKEQPIMAINSSRLLVAAGTTLYSYLFGVSNSEEAPPITLEGSFSLAARRDRCITALAYIPDGGLDQTFFVGFQDGTCERIVLAGRSKHNSITTLHVQRSTGRPLQPPHKDLLGSLSSSGNFLLSLSASGRATLADTESLASSTIELQARSWVSHLSMGTSPYAVFGTSSATPLTVHSIANDRMVGLPSAVLEAENPGSAVYGISQGPPSSLWGSSHQVVVSGWYNGTVSIHDLRSASRSFSTDDAQLPAPLRPVLTLVNSWSVEPIYSVSCGGGSGSHIAAGSARHSLVSLWDIRFPAGGFSAHAPLNDPSPVYGVILESSRLFGVTQSRPFVFDFGPGIRSKTYPYLAPSSRGFNHIDQSGAVDGIGYYVTKYLHPPIRRSV